MKHRISLFTLVALLTMVPVRAFAGWFSPSLAITTNPVTQIEATSAVVNWTTTTKADSWVVVSGLPAFGNPVTTTTHAVRLTGLKPDTTYSVSIRSADARTVAYATATFRTKEALRITDISSTTATETSFTVVWTTNRNATGAVTLSGRSPIYDNTFTTRHSVTVSNLKVNTTYQVQVAAADAEMQVTKSITAKTASLLIWPTEVHKVGDRFGMRMHPLQKVLKLHDGIDIQAPRYAKVVAAHGGIVTKAGYAGNAGNQVCIKNDQNHIETCYDHLEKIDVTKNRSVVQGQVIGSVGSTGGSTGPHLHFQLHENDQAKDPLLYLP